ncbi:hypothetical protein LCGC14_0451250 [marine sediment metagenome]|uniref:Uncharacterized protein n=1 Tax=marine sediment metagenome TaxID=412755 RepID=A0A0F9SNA6_9ZZZZ
MGKGQREYARFQQATLARWSKNSTRGFTVRDRTADGVIHCAKCPDYERVPVADIVEKIDGHWKFRLGRLCVGHKKGRLSHPESKMSEEGVFPICHYCNGMMSGANYKEGEPQWTEKQNR